MKKKNIKKTILLTLGIISMFSIAAFAESGSIVSKGQTVSYWLTPTSGRGNSATEINIQPGVYDYRYVSSTLFTRNKVGNSFNKIQVDHNFEKRIAGATYAGRPAAWTSENSLYENGTPIFTHSFWENAK